MAEDKKKHPSNVWPDSAAAMFFDTRSDDYRNIYDPKGSDTPFFRDLINEEINKFNTVNRSSWVLENDFVDSFVKKIIKQNNTAIITTLYSFIFEKNDIIELIDLRGYHGGSTEPMIMHLFKGSLVFETLFKLDSSNSPTLGTLIKNLFGTRFFEDYKCTKREIETYKDIINYIKKDEFGFPYTAFCVTQKIRNLSAHDLNWENSFTVENYESIYNQIIYAIFYVLEQKFFSV
jgi:hypothetical protein